MSAGILPTDGGDPKLTTAVTRKCSTPRVTLTWPPRPGSDADTLALAAATSAGSAPAMETSFAEDAESSEDALRSTLASPTEDGRTPPPPTTRESEGCGRAGRTQLAGYTTTSDAGRRAPPVGRLQHHDSAALTYHLSSPERTRELYIDRGWRNSIHVTDVR